MATLHEKRSSLPSAPMDQHSSSSCRNDYARSSAFNSADDYEQKYHEDRYGEEVGPNARVWRTYLDEAQEADRELIDNWRDTTDILLVFAGLFSAVVASFVVQTSSALQLNYSQVAASLLFEQIALMRAQADGIPLSTVVRSPLNPDSPATVTDNDRWINRLWFTSLSVSLAAAFVAVLVKQWIQHYVSVVSGTPRDRVRIRQFRLIGVERWNVPMIIGALPMLLHLALLLYFAGLVLYLLPLDVAVAYTIIGVAVSAYTFYVMSNLLPLWYPICPYKTPLSSVLAAAISTLSTSQFVAFLDRCLHTRLYTPPCSEKVSEGSSARRSRSSVLHHLKKIEWEAAHELADEVDARALTWLYSKSSNPSVASIVFQAISGLRNNFPALDILKAAVNMDSVLGIFGTFNLEDPNNGERLTKAERIARAYHHLPSFSQAHAAFRAAQEKIVNHPTVLRRCVDIISLQFDGYPLQQNLAKGGDASLDLEIYKEASAELPLFTWSLLLRYSRLTVFDSPFECWSHAFRVLDNFFWTFERRRSSESEEHWMIKFAMMFEYLCSLSIRHDHGGSGRRQPRRAVSTEWGIDSVLIAYGPIKSSTNILSWTSCMLPGAMQAWCAEGLSQREDDHGHRWVQTVSLCKILRGIRFFKSELALRSGDGLAERSLRQAAANLHRDLQRLVDSDTFWKHNSMPEDRELCFELLFEHAFWFSEEPLRVSWSLRLMDLFLHTTLRKWGVVGSDGRFPHYPPCEQDAYRSCRERDGVTQMDRERCSAEFAAYLSELSSSVKDPSRKQELDYLLQAENLIPAVHGVTMLRDDDGSYRCTIYGIDVVEELWRLFPNHPSWAAVVESLITFTGGRQYLWRWGDPSRILGCLTQLITMLSPSLDSKPRLPEPFKYGYVCGSDIEKDRRELLYLDGHPVYAPYAFPLHDRTEATSMGSPKLMHITIPFLNRPKPCAYTPSSPISEADSTDTTQSPVVRRLRGMVVGRRVEQQAELELRSSLYSV